MVRSFSATEAVDFVCDDFSDGESEREGIQEIYCYHGGTNLRPENWTCLLKPSTGQQELIGKI